jgi:hypothetical protein
VDTKKAGLPITKGFNVNKKSRLHHPQNPSLGVGGFGWFQRDRGRYSKEVSMAMG